MNTSEHSQDEQQCGALRRLAIAMAVVILISIPAFAQSSTPEGRDDQSTIVAAASEAAVRAVNFQQADEGWKRSQADFTPEGWKEFAQMMQPWLDSKGAATFSSTFVPSNTAVRIGQENGIVHFRIPGTLTQQQNQSRTTYRGAAIEVYAIRDLSAHGSTAVKIQHLKQIICVPAANCQ